MDDAVKEPPCWKERDQEAGAQGKQAGKQGGHGDAGLPPKLWGSPVREASANH